MEMEEEDLDEKEIQKSLFAASFERRDKAYFCKGTLANGKTCGKGPLNRQRILAHASGIGGQGAAACKATWNTVEKERFKQMMQQGVSDKKEDANKRKSQQAALDSMMGSADSPQNHDSRHPFSSFSVGTRVSTGGRGWHLSPRYAGRQAEGSWRGVG
jgi:hypothetical protein